MSSSFNVKLIFNLAKNRHQSRGYSLVMAVGTIVVLSALLSSYAVVSRFESLTSSSSERSGAGFYAAEAGLNLRAEEVRAIFEDFDIPNGTSEDISVVGLPCRNGIGGTDDYACVDYQFQEFTTQTGLAFDRLSSIVIPPGEPFQFLNAQEFRYLASAISYRNDVNRPQAILGMNFLNRSVPLFQFMAFFDKDLEITPGSSMTVNGPIHANANIFVDVDGGTLNITDRITVGSYPDETPGNIFRQEKQLNECNANPVEIINNLGNPENFDCVPSRDAITIPASFSDRIQLGLPRLEVPPIESFGVGADSPYWANAELRIAMVTNGTSRSIEARTVNNTIEPVLTSLLNGSCSPTGSEAVRVSTDFYNAREDKQIEMLEVDMQRLLDCIQANSGAFGFQLDDDTQNGLVFYFTVIGPDSDNLNGYGVRLSNGRDLQSSIAGANTVQGLTVVTDQASYVWGDYNAGTDWVPAAILSDSFNILSNAWDDFTDDGDGVNDSVTALACTGRTESECPFEERFAVDTTVNAAFLSGTSTTGTEGAVNTSGGSYNGGFENYPRLHEIWNTRSGEGPPTRTLTIAGSFVSLGEPEHVAADWIQGNPDPATPLWFYQQPVRNWSFETRFRDPNQLPPLTPQANFLRQELFVRDFNR